HFCMADLQLTCDLMSCVLVCWGVDVLVCWIFTTWALHMDNATRERIRRLHALVGSSNEGESNNARRKLLELLAKYNKTWNDISELIKEDVPEQAPKAHGTAAPRTKFVPAVVLVDHILRQYVGAKEHEYVGVALWTLHTPVYQRYLVSPRLALTSPVRGCG